MASLSVFSSPHEREVYERCVKSVLEFIVLKALEAEPMCGYDVMGHIHERYRVLLSPGSVYPLLRSMERDGFIDQTAMEKKKVFRLTHAGRDAVKDLFERYMKILALTRPEHV